MTPCGPTLPPALGPPLAGEYDKPRAEVLCDQFRLSYFQQYISNATAAVQQDGVDLIVSPYLACSCDAARQRRRGRSCRAARAAAHRARSPACITSPGALVLELACFPTLTCFPLLPRLLQGYFAWSLLDNFECGWGGRALQGGKLGLGVAAPACCARLLLAAPVPAARALTQRLPADPCAHLQGLMAIPSALAASTSTTPPPSWTATTRARPCG